ncbi:MAG: DEAD/DEAH box helicase [Patescibacteria group bacterium]
MITLKPFQEIGRDFLALRSSALLADDMGLGKTVQSIEAAKKITARNGIVTCPFGMRRTWVKTLRSQYPTIFIKEITSPNIIPDANAFNVVNYDIVWREPLIRYLHQGRWKVLIADEAHFLKSIDAKRTKAILGRGGIYGNCEYRWLLTGTPVMNRPIELYPMLRCLCPEKLGPYKEYTQYAYQFCGAFQDTFGFNVSGASNLDKLSALLQPFMLRRMKSEVLDQLPPLCHKIYLDPSNKLVSLTDEEKLTIGENPSLRRALGLLKAGPAIRHIEDILTDKPKVIAYTYHQDVARMLQDHFGSKAVKYTGEENLDKKEAAKAAFINDPKVQVFIGQVDAAGTGTDGLQAVCDTCVFVELTYVPKQIEQCIDRLNRMGQENQVVAHFLIVEDSMEERIVDTLVEKSININQIMQEKKGGGQFIQAPCGLCGALKEMKELRRVAGLSVCIDKCAKEMECMT